MMKKESLVRKYFLESGKLSKKIDINQIKRVLDSLENTALLKKKLFLAGNGGSAATVSHMVCDLVKNVGKGKFKIISLVDNIPMMSAYANDVSNEVVFSGVLENLGEKGDVLLVLSASGNSPNILKAIRMAKKLGLKTIGFLGFDGGKALRLLDEYVLIPSNSYGLVEDYHLMLGHIITEYFK